MIADKYCAEKMLRYTDIVLVTRRNPSKYGRPQFTKRLHVVASSDIMRTFL